MKGATFMAHPVNSSYSEEYTLIADRKSPTPTVFTLGVLDTLLRVHIDDSHTTLTRLIKGVKMSESQVHHKYLEMVRYARRGWRGFKRADGTEVPFDAKPIEIPQVGIRTAVTDEALANLDAVDLMELGIRISQLNTVSREQRKN